MNSWKRKALAIVAVPLLSGPSAIGVYSWLAPQVGPAAAGMAAVGFEALYIATAILILTTPELQAYARNVALAAVGTAVVMNTLAHYAAAIPTPKDAVLFYAFTKAPAFDGLGFALAFISSVPLAGLSYAMSVLLHRLSAADVNAMSPVTHRTSRPKLRRTRRPQYVTVAPALLAQDDTMTLTNETVTQDETVSNDTATTNETKEARVRELMVQYGKSRSTIFRWIDTGKVTL